MNYLRRVAFLGCALAAALIPAAQPAVAQAPSDSLRAEPVPTPFDSPPALSNASEVRVAIREQFPANVEAVNNGAPIVMMLIGTDGRVYEAQVYRSSGSQELDEAAIAVTDAMEFLPASLEGAAVAVWVALPVLPPSTPGI